ncbi:OmpH family outer membrane protein [Roseococcus sp. SDR]|uniref:OmpH family outer membrane protein n=1 Tax=Roseococcus sp. SDR TaxID=2835532 RepID=UPI001BCC348B|nr:OmpH family outer membrane protein [Roseococcus sp. SDR]MBS7790497.1 OmpH family outer membrane protein [Roseococcus sp. SDR]MBV1845811.1 OmpH family outer membrane protein [Roseococcus sp. SDR]
MTSFRTALALLLMASSPALAQQNQEWFVPGQGGQRPQGQQQQRPPQQPQGQPQRPPQGQPARPAALPPGSPPPTAVIGIVDIPEIQRLSTAFNQVREEIERRRTRLNDDLQREQNGWREAQQALSVQRTQMTPDQIRARERELQDRITDSQRIFRNRSQAIEQAAQQSLMQIEEALAGVVRQVAASRSVNIVVPRPLVIMNDPGFDLTEEVAQQFNRTLRQVTIAPDSDGANPPAPPTPPARPAAPAPAQQPRRN